VCNAHDPRPTATGSRAAHGPGCRLRTPDAAAWGGEVTPRGRTKTIIYNAARPSGQYRCSGPAPSALASGSTPPGGTRGSRASRRRASTRTTWRPARNASSSAWTSCSTASPPGCPPTGAEGGSAVLPVAARLDRTRAGPTGTNRAGRCPTGTSTPVLPRCSSCSPSSTNDLVPCSLASIRKSWPISAPGSGFLRNGRRLALSLLATPIREPTRSRPRGQVTARAWMS